MRHNITLKLNSQLKGLEIITPSLNGFYDLDLMKIMQNQCQIYTVFKCGANNDSSMKHIEMSSELLRRNGFNQGQVQVQKVIAAQIDSIIVQTNSLDYKIINNRSRSLQSQFLNQIAVVWPNAIIPLYYTPNDYVVLKIRCDTVAKISTLTRVSVQMEQKQMNDNYQMGVSSVRNNSKQWNLKLRKLNKEINVNNFGYMNQIYISEELYAKMGFEDRQVKFIIQNATLFDSIPSYEEIIEKKKLQLNKFIHKQSIVTIRSRNSNDHLKEQMWYQCSSLVKIANNLSQEIIINNDDKNNILKKKQQRTLQFLLKTKQYYIELTKLCSIINQNEIKQIKQYFIIQFLQILQKEKQFLFLPQNQPFCINKQLFYIKLCHKKQKKIKEKQKQKQQKQKKQKQKQKLQFIFLLIVNTDQQNFTQIQKKQAINNLFNKIIIRQNIISPLSSSYTLKQMYMNQQKWIKVQNQLQYIFNQTQNQFNKIFNLIYSSQLQHIINTCNKISTGNILITSFNNNGKSNLQKILSQFGYRSWFIDFKLLNNTANNYMDICLYLEFVVQFCPYRFIFIDNFDTLCSHYDNAQSHHHQLMIVSKLITKNVQKLASNYKKIFIVTAKNQHNINEDFHFDQLVQLRNPNREQREKVINNFYSMENSNQKIIQHKLENQQQLEQFLDHTQSLSLGSFSAAIINKNTAMISDQNKKKSKIFNFSKLAGLKEAKKIITNIIETPIKYSAFYKEIPIKIPRGILIYGASGNGKSVLGQSLKDQFSMKYLTIKGSDILSKYIGGSQAAVREVFEKGMSMSPCIIFFDEFESMVPRRNASGTGVTDRVVNQFLCYLDGVSSTQGVFIVTASSRPDLIDPALLRPGRIDTHIYLDYPSAIERQQVLTLFSQSIQIDIKTEEIIKKTQHYSYSDLIGLLKQLKIKHSSKLLKNSSLQINSKLISNELFNEIFQGFKISTNEKQQYKLNEIYMKFQNKQVIDISKQKWILK